MNKYRLLKMNSRSGRYYAEEIATGLRQSLKTADKATAEKLLHALNESHRNPHLNQLMGQTYLAGSDPNALTRTWQDVLTAILDTKKEGSHGFERNQPEWTQTSGYTRPDSPNFEAGTPRPNFDFCRRKR